MGTGGLLGNGAEEHGDKSSQSSASSSCNVFTTRFPHPEQLAHIVLPHTRKSKRTPSMADMNAKLLGILSCETFSLLEMAKEGEIKYQKIEIRVR